MLLQDKTILITGGSRGLGRAMCLQFAAAGAAVAFTYHQDETSAQQTKQEIESFGVAALPVKASVVEEQAMLDAVKTIETELGAIDILVNNAGVSQPLPFALIEVEDWDKVLDTNVKGHYIAARAAVPGMIRRKSGVILNIASLAGLRIIEAPVHYSTSKAAIKGFTEAMCKELSRYKIRVNCLAPGLLDEGVGLNLPQHRLKDYLDNTALGRVGHMSEVAKFACFMVSDRNSYMNGETIMISGGF